MVSIALTTIVNRCTITQSKNQRMKKEHRDKTGVDNYCKQACMIKTALAETLQSLELTTSEIVTKTGVTKSEISNFKTGKRAVSLEKALEISVKLKCQTYFLNRLKIAIFGQIETMTGVKQKAVKQQLQLF